jgi:hypothetical protein
MLISLSILFTVLLITSLVLLIANYKASNRTILLLTEQDNIILDMEILNETFLNDLKRKYHN